MKKFMFSLTIFLLFMNLSAQRAINGDQGNVLKPEISLDNCLIAVEYYNSNNLNINDEDNPDKNIPMNVTISYAPLLGLWIGPWPLGLNLSLTQKYFEISSSFSYHSETSSDPKDVFFNLSIGGRYLFPSQSNTHFFMHGLVGYVFHKESHSGVEGFFFGPYSANHSGISLIPGLGIDIKKPSTAGIRLGLNFIACPGYDTKVWSNSFTGAFQLTVGFIF